MQTFFLFALIIASVGLMVIAISKWKIHPFIVMTVIALLVGLIWGAVYPESELTPAKVVNSVKSGFGDIMTSIGIVILCGTIIGTILEKTGAALTMANAILKLVGKKRSVVAMGAMGYVTGIPVFCDSGFVVLSPISRALAAQSNVSLAVMGTALSGGLYATHCLVPPTPGPIAMAGTLNADLGLTILVGLVISIPAVVVAVLYAKLVASKIDIPANSEYTLDELKEKYGKLPGTLHSFSPILLPIVLIALSSVAGRLPRQPLRHRLPVHLHHLHRQSRCGSAAGCVPCHNADPRAGKIPYSGVGHSGRYGQRCHPRHHRCRRLLRRHPEAPAHR